MGGDKDPKSGESHSVQEKSMRRKEKWKVQTGEEHSGGWAWSVGRGPSPLGGVV